MCCLQDARNALTNVFIYELSVWEKQRIKIKMFALPFSYAYKYKKIVRFLEMSREWLNRFARNLCSKSLETYWLMKNKVLKFMSCLSDFPFVYSRSKLYFTQKHVLFVLRLAIWIRFSSVIRSFIPTEAVVSLCGDGLSVELGRWRAHYRFTRAVFRSWCGSIRFQVLPRFFTRKCVSIRTM
jgi:hypothetical protein